MCHLFPWCELAVSTCIIAPVTWFAREFGRHRVVCHLAQLAGWVLLRFLAWYQVPGTPLTGSDLFFICVICGKSFPPNLIHSYPIITHVLSFVFCSYWYFMFIVAQSVQYCVFNETIGVPPP